MFVRAIKALKVNGFLDFQCFGCEKALNLDGGGSSSLIVNGSLINNPIGLKSEREVMSFIAAMPN